MADKKSTFTTNPEAVYEEQERPPPEEVPERPTQFQPPKGGMSEAALKRCRRLIITDAEVTGVYRKLLTVKGPAGSGAKVLEQLSVRTPQDLARVRRAWCAKYRIPPENVTEKGDG